MRVYLDTSVLVAALTIEDATSRAQVYLVEGNSWIVSDWATAEFSAAVRAKAARGELLASMPPRLDAALDELIEASGETALVQSTDHFEARQIVISDGRIRAPDALHIAIARRLGAQLATFDLRQSEAAQMAGVVLHTQ